MTGVEFDFLADQRGSRKMFCDDVVDKKWKKTADRKAKELESFRKREEKAKEQVRKMYEKVEFTDEMVDEVFRDICNQDDDDDDIDFIPDEEEEEEEGEEQVGKENQPPKRRRLQNSSIDENADCPIPEQFRHIRNSIKGVKPEYYAAIVELKTKYHCSDAQAVAGVVLTGQKLFQLPWKFFSTDKSVIDLDTVPSTANNQREARVRELFVLAEIAEKVMSSDDTSTIAYHDDGSRKQGTGAFSVQGISIDRTYHPLPTLSIARETRANLVELKVTMSTRG